MKEKKPMRRKFVLIALAFAVLMIAPGSASADGVTDIRINPATGVTISVSGSYRLVSDVTMTAGVMAINISAANVTFDLGGHTIGGFAGNNSDGIFSSQQGVVVMNGTVIGFGDSGIQVQGTRCVVRDVHVTGCNITGGNAAINVGITGVVENCNASENDAASGIVRGILAGDSARIVNNIVNGNSAGAGGAIAITSGSDSIIADNVITDNSGTTAGAVDGIFAGFRCIVRGNKVSNNDNAGTGEVRGIVASSGALIEGNTISNHTTGTTATGSTKGIATGGSTVIGNDCSGNSAGAGSNGSAVGIDGGTGSVIRNNRCDQNNGAGTGTSSGISVLGSCRVEGNHCRSNTGGAASHGIRVTQTANLIIGNSTTGHSDGGIIFLTAAGNRCESNRGLSESQTIETTAPGVAPFSVGTGDLANVPN